MGEEYNATEELDALRKHGCLPWYQRLWYHRMKPFLDFFRYDLKYGISNLVLFFGVVWRWRGWSHEYDYEIFMRAIALHQRKLLKFHSHEHWQRDVAGMDLTLKRWRLLQDGELHWRTEKKVWDLMHDHLKNNAEGWWD